MESPNAELQNNSEPSFFVTAFQPPSFLKALRPFVEYSTLANLFYFNLAVLVIQPFDRLIEYGIH